jgi:hypothetical protein
MAGRTFSPERGEAMAVPRRNSLKVVDGNDEISVAGYTAVVENIILNAAQLADFESGPNDFTADRTRKLIRHAATDGQGNRTGAVIKQLDHNDQPETLTPENCRIKAKRDKPRPANGHSEVTMSLPEQALNVGDLVYIDNYIKKFMEVYNPDVQFPQAKNDRTAAQARKYMLGVFMLTKCR